MAISHFPGFSCDICAQIPPLSALHSKLAMLTKLLLDVASRRGDTMDPS